MLYTAIIFSVCAIVFVYWLFQRKTDIPGPKGYPLIGSLLDVIKSPENRLDLFEEWRQKYGDVYQVSVFGKKMVFISDFEDMRTVLKHKNIFISDIVSNPRAVESLKLDLSVRRDSFAFDYWKIPFLVPKEEKAFMHSMDNVVIPFIKQVMEKAENNLKLPGYKPQNIVEEMLVEKDGEIWTSESILSNILGIYLAGVETTASVMVSVMYALCKYPEFQDIIYNEVEPMMKKENPDFADFMNNTKLLNFVKEVLRLYGPILLLFRKPIKPYKLQSKHGTFEIPAGANVILNTQSGYQDETNYVDAKIFNPDRYNTPGVTPYFGFGGVPRICPGQHLAIIELAILSAVMCYHFRISPAPGCILEDVKFVSKPAVRCKGLSVQLSMRQV